MWSASYLGLNVYSADVNWFLSTLRLLCRHLQITRFSSQRHVARRRSSILLTIEILVNQLLDLVSLAIISLAQVVIIVALERFH